MRIPFLNIVLSLAMVLASMQTAIAADPGRPTIGLALGGGGVRGAAHIGVLRVFEREKIPIDFIAGTSMGAIVGGLYAAGLPLEEIHKKFQNKSMLRNYNTVPIPVRLAVVPIFFIPHLFGHHPLDGLYRGNQFATWLNKSVPENERELTGLKIPFVAVCTNLLDGKAFAIKKGNFGRALQASSAIPVLRRPVVYQGDDGQDALLVDGGIAANVPIMQAKEQRPDILIAVDVNECLNKTTVKDYHAIGSVSKRLLVIYLAQEAKPQLKYADVLIHPDVNGIPLITGNLKRAEEAICAGEKAAEAALPEIRAAIAKFQGTKAATASSGSDND